MTLMQNGNVYNHLYKVIITWQNGTSYNKANIATRYFHHFIPLSSLSLSQLVECDVVKLNYISLMRLDTSSGALNKRSVEDCLCLRLSQSPYNIL